MGHSGSEAQQEDPNENGTQSDIADCNVVVVVGFFGGYSLV